MFFKLSKKLSHVKGPDDVTFPISEKDTFLALKIKLTLLKMWK